MTLALIIERSARLGLEDRLCFTTVMVPLGSNWPAGTDKWITDTDSKPLVNQLWFEEDSDQHSKRVS